MARLKINDLPLLQDLSEEQIRGIYGGFLIGFFARQAVSYGVRQAVPYVRPYLPAQVNNAINTATNRVNSAVSQARAQLPTPVNSAINTVNNAVNSVSSTVSSWFRW